MRLGCVCYGYRLFVCVVHAAITDLDGISVEDFSELVIFGKVLVY